jgi:hypothetical protein
MKNKEFADLLKEDLGFSGGQQQQRAIDLFPALVRQSHLEEWQPGQDMARSASQVVWIGVAIYSILELEMLDALEEKLSRETRAEKIYAFNVSTFRDFADFERVLPGIGKVYQTPVVGFWTNGVLEVKLWGAAARDYVKSRFNLPS